MLDEIYAAFRVFIAETGKEPNAILMSYDAVASLMTDNYTQAAVQTGFIGGRHSYLVFGMRVIPSNAYAEGFELALVRSRKDA